MLSIEMLAKKIDDHIEEVLGETSEVGPVLWKDLLGHHPADIAAVVEHLREENQVALFKKFPRALSAKVFEEASPSIQTHVLSQLDTEHATLVLKHMPADKLTHLFDYLSDEHLQEYLKLLQKKQRHHIISTLNFAPKSAGRIMNSDALTFHKDFTVKKCISVLQRLTEKKDIFSRLFVTDEDDRLIGHIDLEQLVLAKPETTLVQIMQPDVFIAKATDEQQHVADQMHHYSTMIVPVIDEQQHFLGVITADDIFDVFEDEATEEAYKMSGLAPTEHSYFETPFWQLIQQRGSWLVGLLLLQSASSIILANYQNMIQANIFLSLFYGMLTGTGGNAGNQSSTIVIRGLATGEITLRNGWRVILRELGVSMVMGVLLMVIAFGRVFATCSKVYDAMVICVALFFIVLSSILLGTLIPMILQRMRVDPAHSAAPFLATLMDVLGALILCMVAQSMLS